MRLIHLTVLFVAAASTSASIGPLVGVAGGVAAVGKSFANLVGAAMLPAGVLFPLAIVGSLKALVGVKTLGLIKLKLKAPILAPIAAGFAGKAAIAHVKTHLAKTAVQAKAALIDGPVKLVAMKVGAIHGAMAGGRAGLTKYESLHKPNSGHPEVIPAAVLLSQPTPAPMPQPEPEEASYGQKAPTHSPPAPAYTPTPPVHTPAAPAYVPAHAPAAPAYVPAPADVPAQPAYGPASEANSRKRRDAEATDAEVAEKAITEAFEIILSRDTDHCARRSICAIAVQPSLAGVYGSDVLTTLKNLREDSNAPWQPYRHAVITGEGTQSHEACAQEYPACTKDIEALIAEAMQQFE